MTLRVTLLADGTSDRALLPIIAWTVRAHAPTLLLDSQVANLSRLRHPPAPGNLAGRMQKALDIFPCDVLFVHRDAERADALPARRDEIAEAAAVLTLPLVPVIPVRMTEAWLLFDEAALRRAAGNPAGRMDLQMPAMAQLERIHAKDELAARLRAASALTGRRAARFHESRAIQRIPDFIQDFSPLRQLPSFAAFEAQVAAFVQGWPGAV